MLQVGLWNVVSVPDGAPSTVKEEHDLSQDRKFSYFYSCKDMLQKPDFSTEVPSPPLQLAPFSKTVSLTATELPSACCNNPRVTPGPPVALCRATGSRVACTACLHRSSRACCTGRVVDTCSDHGAVVGACCAGDPGNGC